MSYIPMEVSMQLDTPGYVKVGLRFRLFISVFYSPSVAMVYITAQYQMTPYVLAQQAVKCFLQPKIPWESDQKDGFTTKTFVVLGWDSCLDFICGLELAEGWAWLAHGKYND